MMKLGIISDTHSLVRPEVYKVFDGVDLILHAGDIGSQDVIIELEAIAPVKAVLGNNDYDFPARFKETLCFPIEKRIFKVQHIFQGFPEKDGIHPVKNVLVFGHSHKPCNEHIGDTLYFNPGSAGPRRFKLDCSVGRITLQPNGVEAEIIDLFP